MCMRPLCNLNFMENFVNLRHNLLVFDKRGMVKYVRRRKTVSEIFLKEKKDEHSKETRRAWKNCFAKRHESDTGDLPKR